MLHLTLYSGIVLTAAVHFSSGYAVVRWHCVSRKAWATQVHLLGVWSQMEGHQLTARCPLWQTLQFLEMYFSQWTNTWLQSITLWSRVSYGRRQLDWSLLGEKVSRFYRAIYTIVHSAVLRPSVRLSVCPSCNVGGLWSHRLEILESNCTDN